MSSAPALNTSVGVIELTAAICDIESVSGNENALANAIETTLRLAGHLEVIRDADAIVARTNLGRAQRVIVAGHIDTVPVNNNLPTRLENDMLWGRGTVDMKAGVAVALKLAVELATPRHDITWIFYDHEEVSADLNGLGRIAHTRPDLLEADFAILGEPSNGAVEGGCNGTIRVAVTTTGKRAHSARAWMGENAIHKLGPALTTLAAYAAASVEVEGLVYRESLSAVSVTGGVAGNVIPDAATLMVNYRFAPDKSVEQALAHLHEVFAGYTLNIDDSAPGARPGLTSAIAIEFVAAVGAAPAAKYGWTDVARFSEFGIPAINFGPGDPSLAHADDERVPTAQIVECERVLRSWLS
jgi:succinyl-diaminopimelate desuccinylase